MVGASDDIVTVGADVFAQDSFGELLCERWAVDVEFILFADGHVKAREQEARVVGVVIRVVVGEEEVVDFSGFET